MHHFDVNFSKFWRKNMNSLYVNLVRRIFSYKYFVQKTCIDYLKMHSECTILMHFLKKFPGEAPRPPTYGRGWPLHHPPPFGASRLSEAFGFIGHLCPPPLRQWRFWIRPWQQKCKEYLNVQAELSATGRVVRYVRPELSATGRAVHGPSCPGILRYDVVVVEEYIPPSSEHL